MEALLRDPYFPMLASRLAGAAEMASVVLTSKDDPQVQEVGRTLGVLAAWFFEDGTESVPAPGVRPELPPATDKPKPGGVR